MGDKAIVIDSMLVLDVIGCLAMCVAVTLFVLNRRRTRRYQADLHDLQYGIEALRGDFAKARADRLADAVDRVDRVIGEIDELVDGKSSIDPGVVVDEAEFARLYREYVHGRLSYRELWQRLRGERTGIEA